MKNLEADAEKGVRILSLKVDGGFTRMKKPRARRKSSSFGLDSHKNPELGHSCCIIEQVVEVTVENYTLWQGVKVSPMPK